jgi:hypothetical protein
MKIPLNEGASIFCLAMRARTTDGWKDPSRTMRCASFTTC